MTYVSVGQLGGARAADDCWGKNRSEPEGDFCCPTKTWYNWVYKNIKGADTLRWSREMKVRRALSLLLDPAADGSDTGVQAAAWAMGEAGVVTSVDDVWLATLRRAANNYHAVFPADRWTKIANGVFTPCTSSGFYSTMIPGPVEASLSAVLTRGAFQNTPERFFDHANNVIGDVPGGHGDQYRGTEPDLLRDLIVTVPVPPSKGSGRTVGSRPWLAGFVRVFAPSDPKYQFIVVAAVKRFGQASRPPVLFRDTILDEDKKSKLPWVAVAAGAALLLGAGVYAVSRKKR